MDAGSRPRSHANEDIIIVVVPQPKRETQVVANAEAKTHTPPFHRYLLISGSIVLRLAPVREEVVLIIEFTI
jgi:hypothetical protein